MPKKKSTKRVSKSQSASVPDVGSDLNESTSDPLELLPDTEPVVERESKTLPIWLLVLIGAVMFWGDIYLINYGGGFDTRVYRPYRSLAEVSSIGPKSPEEIFAAKGKVAYGSYCSVCHQPNGEGQAGMFPPVAGSDWVNTEGPERLIRIVLNGLTGPITVNGSEYNSVMVAWKDNLSDKDIAAVLTYIRTNESWGNSAGAVTPEQVAEIRQATSNRSNTDYWTAEELLGIPLSSASEVAE